VFKLIGKYKDMSFITVGDGSTCLLWSDAWHGPPLSIQYPELYSFSRYNNVSVSTFQDAVHKESFFYLPFSVEAFGQYQTLLLDLDSLNLNQTRDSWSYNWGSGLFLSAKAYQHLLGTVIVSQVFQWLWKSSALPKRKVFFWLALVDRLNTREILRRRNMDLLSHNCVLCLFNEEETLRHLFLDCPFAISYWNMLGLAQLIQPNLFDTIPLFSSLINKPFFMEIIIAMFWGIWSARNDVIFKNRSHSLQAVKIIFKQELAWVTLRANKSVSSQLKLWLDNFV